MKQDSNNRQDLFDNQLPLESLEGVTGGASIAQKVEILNRQYGSIPAVKTIVANYRAGNIAEVISGIAALAMSHPDIWAKVK